MAPTQPLCPSSMAAKESTTDGGKTGRAYKGKESERDHLKSRKFSSWVVCGGLDFKGPQTFNLQHC